MNLVIYAPDWLLWILCALLILAAAEDLWRLRISNLLSLAVLATALAAMAFAGFKPALWQNAAAFTLVLIAGTLLFGAGKFGGGDVKLFAAVTLWFNLQGALMLIASIFIAGGVVALVFILLRNAIHRIRKDRTARAAGKLPYGLAIAAGGLFALYFVAPSTPGYQSEFPVSLPAR